MNATLTTITMFYKNIKIIPTRTLLIDNLLIVILLILCGTFTIIPSFEQIGNLDWNQICNTVEFALYNSCDVYVSSSGQLTAEGERAFGCIRNGLFLGGAAYGFSAPLEIIIPGLNILAGLTGCSEIVKLDLLSNIGNPSQLLNTLTQMLSGKGFTNTIPQNEFNQNTIPQKDFSDNTSPSDEFLLFNNELFSVYYPSDWIYEEFQYLGEPNVIFQPKNNATGDIVQIATYKTEDKNLEELILKAKNQQSNYTLSNNTEAQITDISTENIYLGNYPAFKGTLIANSESFPFTKVIIYDTIANGKLYTIGLMSHSNDPTETNPVFERMVSSFEIFPIETTTESKSSFDNNDQQYSWNWRVSDGILTYKVNSSDLKFRNMIDSAFNEWEEKISPLIVFEKIKYGNADITFDQVQNLAIDKSDNNKIEIDNGATILNIISNSSLIDSIEINILKDIDVKAELEESAVIKHLIGHALGLIKHSENENSIMYPSSANYGNQKISLCGAYNVHIINFGKDSDSPIDKNVCNSIENNQNDFTNTSPTYEDKSTETIINKLFTPVSANASAIGEDKSKLTIVEFGDYQSPFCARFNKETKDSLILNFVNSGKVRFIFKDFIVNDLPGDKASTLAAEASYCAAEQGKYWDYHDELYRNSNGENTGWVTRNNLKQFANNVDVPDWRKFSDCLDSNKYNHIVMTNDKLARSIGLTSTPSFILYNGTTPVAIQGAYPYSVFEQVINEMS